MRRFEDLTVFKEIAVEALHALHSVKARLKTTKSAAAFFYVVKLFGDRGPLSNQASLNGCRLGSCQASSLKHVSRGHSDESP